MCFSGYRSFIDEEEQWSERTGVFPEWLEDAIGAHTHPDPDICFPMPNVGSIITAQGRMLGRGKHTR